MLDLTNDKRMTVIKNFLRDKIENNVPLPIYLDNFEMVLLHDLVSMLSSYYKGAASGDIILDQKGKYEELTDEDFII